MTQKKIGDTNARSNIFSNSTIFSIVKQ